MTFRPEAAEIFASECSAQQKAWAMQFRSVRRLESDHSPFLSMPEKLAALIAELSPGVRSS